MGIVKRSFQVAIVVALACIVFDLIGCCGCKSETEARPNEAKRGGLWLQDARHVEGELTLLIRNITLLRGDDLRQDNISKGLPGELKPHLYVWASCAVDRLNQRDVAEHAYPIAPTREYWDWDNGNKIAFWDLTKEAQDGTTITLRRRIRYTAYETCYEIDPDSVEPYKRGSRLYKFYTKSEPLI